MNSHPSRKNALDATILVLPPEITVNIFRLCLPALIAAESDLDFATPPSPSSREAPLLLTQICRQWRDICLDTPEMWTSINPSRNGSIELLELWLSRTRNRPLTISLLIMDNCHNSRACTFMQAIMSRCSQWRDVRLHLPYCAIQQLDMSIFPRMERFRLSTDDTTGWAPNSAVGIRDAPLLRYANLNFVPQVDIPLEHLTTLRFHYAFNTDQTVAILGRCRNLLDLSWYKAGRNTMPDPPPARLPLLRSVKIGDPRLLLLLTAPRLERLAMRVDSSAHAAGLQGLVLRSSCNLRSLFLSVTKYDPTTADIQPFLGAAGTVVHLELDGVTTSVMSALRAVDTLPRLKNLEIRDFCQHSLDSEWDDYYDLEYGSLIEMLRWRQENDAPLESFDLFLYTSRGSFVRAPPAELITAFRDLGKAGLHVRVTHDRGVFLDTHPV